MLKIKVLIVDDDALIRESLKVLFELNSIEVLSLCSDANEAINICKQERPDIVLMDIRMPNMDGIIGTKKIKEIDNSIKIVLLTTFKDDEYILQAIKNGADGYILKNQSIESIIESLKAVLKGGVVFDSQIYGNISEMVNKKKNKSLEDIGLSSREIEIIQCIADGLSNKEIAQKLYISEGTVRNYISTILQKLNLRDRTQLVVYFYKNFI
ncbi:response regulator [Caldicellulosiruptoraceae bacterium PP1]